MNTYRVFVSTRVLVWTNVCGPRACARVCVCLCTCENARVPSARSSVPGTAHWPLPARQFRSPIAFAYSMDHLLASIRAADLSDDEKEMLRGALETENDGVKKKEVRKTQSCLNFRQFQTAKEWDSLAGPALRAAKSAQVASQGWGIGITCPTEPTVEEMTLVATAFDRDARASGSEMKNAFEDMKAAIKKLDKTQKHPFPHETKFPNSPSELSAALFNYAYPNEPPVSVDAPELKVAAASFKMRGQGSGSSSSGSMADSLAEAIKTAVGTSRRAEGVGLVNFQRSSTRLGNSLQAFNPLPSRALTWSPPSQANSVTGVEEMERNLLAATKEGKKKKGGKKAKDEDEEEEEGEDEESEEEEEEEEEEEGEDEESEEGEEEEEEEEEESEEEEEEPDAPTTSKKRPLAVKTPAAAVKRPFLAKTPAAVVMRPAAAVSTGGGSSMPRLDGTAEPVMYRGARIYIACKRRAFRIILNPPDMYSEISVAWGADPRAAWERAKERVRAQKA